MALCCDIRIAADNTRYAFPEASRGLGARLSSVMLSRRLPHAIANEMLFTAEPYDLQELKRYGLINQIVPREQLMEAAVEMAQRVMKCAPLSLRRIKENSYKGAGLTIRDAMLLNVGPDVYASEDRAEGARAFVEKAASRLEGSLMPEQALQDLVVIDLTQGFGGPYATAFFADWALM